MTLHDRLKNPTMEAAPVRRASHSFTLAIALAVLAAGFAYAMPRLQNVSAEVEDPSVLLEATPTATATPEVSPTPTPTATDEPDEPDDEGSDGDNHGKVVSTAAHCDIKGKAHGELVRSIAQDKDATVADAEAACEAALAAQEAAVDEPKSNNGRGGEEKAPKPDKGHPHDDSDDSDDSGSDDDSGEDDSEEVSDDSGSDDSGGPGNGKGHGKP